MSKPEFFARLAPDNGPMSSLLGIGRNQVGRVKRGQIGGREAAVATAMKAKTTVTNRWLAEHLKMGNVDELIRKVAQWVRDPDFVLGKNSNQPQITQPDPSIDCLRLTPEPFD